ncbi:MAG: NAD-dependent deacylase [Anaerolineales bacterium]|nr:NAD-dependent deacylase [Anaerolineales bacterium]MDW8446933.1 NAD-dependent deacylase [Anaerolineales bacterium]
MEFPRKLLEALRQAQRIAALTGAGVSQESGLRTFREAQDGLWAQYRPEDLATPQAFQRNPKLVWDWYAWRRERVYQAKPNPAHYALAELARLVPHFTLITQNVDGLHQAAGSPNVIELHGNIRRVRCSVCGQVYTQWEQHAEEVPRCRSCNGLLRPDVVWFGENLPPAELEAAFEAARTCELFFSIGTSGVVQPAASLAYLARREGARIVEINAEATPLTPFADFAFQGKAGVILPALVHAAFFNPPH